MAGDEGAEYTVQPEETGPECRAYGRFKDFVISIVSGMKRSYVFIRDLVCMFSYFSHIRTERPGNVSTGSYCLPDNR